MSIFRISCDCTPVFQWRSYIKLITQRGNLSKYSSLSSYPLIIMFAYRSSHVHTPYALPQRLYSLSLQAVSFLHFYFRYMWYCIGILFIYLFPLFSSRRAFYLFFFTFISLILSHRLVL